MKTFYPHEFAPGSHEILPRFFIVESAPQAEWLRKHAKRKGTNLRERALAAMSTSALDLPLYRELLAQTLHEHGRSQKIVELGAGDGRITHELLALGFENILVVEGNASALHSLYHSLTDAQHAYVQLLCADILTLYWPYEYVDAVVAIESLSYLNTHFESVLESINKALVREGTFVHSELMQDGNVLYALAFQDIDHIRSALDKHFLTMFGTCRCFTLEEMEHIYEQIGFKMQLSAPIPALNGILSTTFHRISDQVNNKKEVLMNVKEFFSTWNIPRAQFFVGKKE